MRCNRYGISTKDVQVVLHVTLADMYCSGGEPPGMNYDTCYTAMAASVDKLWRLEPGNAWGALYTTMVPNSHKHRMKVPLNSPVSDCNNYRHYKEQLISETFVELKKGAKDQSQCKSSPSNAVSRHCQTVLACSLADMRTGAFWVKIHIQTSIQLSAVMQWPTLSVHWKCQIGHNDFFRILQKRRDFSSCWWLNNGAHGIQTRRHHICCVQSRQHVPAHVPT